jgi:flagellar protein FliO/FliZ
VEQSVIEQPTGVPVSYEGAFIKMLLTLGGLVVLIFLTVWLLRRLSQGRLLGGSGASRSIKILEKRALSPKSVLYLIEVGGKQVLIAESHLEVRRLETIELEVDTD